MEDQKKAASQLAKVNASRDSIVAQLTKLLDKPVGDNLVQDMDDFALSLAAKMDGIRGEIKAIETLMNKKDEDLRIAKSLEEEASKRSQGLDVLRKLSDEASKAQAEHQGKIVALRESLGSIDPKKVGEDLAKNKTALEQADAESKAITKAWNEAEQKQTALKTKEESNHANLESHGKALAEAETKLHQIIIKNGFQDLKDAQSAVLFEDDEFLKNRKAVQDYEATLSRLKHSHEEHVQKGYASLSIVDLTPLDEKAKEDESLYIAAVQEQSAFATKVDGNRKVLNDAKDILRSKEEAIVWANKVEYLSRVANGKTSSQHFNFEVFYQRRSSCVSSSVPLPSWSKSPMGSSPSKAVPSTEPKARRRSVWISMSMTPTRARLVTSVPFPAASSSRPPSHWPYPFPRSSPNVTAMSRSTACSSTKASVRSMGNPNPKSFNYSNGSPRTTNVPLVSSRTSRS